MRKPPFCSIFLLFEWQKDRMKTRNAISLRYAVIYGAAWNIFKLKKPMDIDRHADHQIGAICQWAVIVIMLGFIVEKTTVLSTLRCSLRF